ncbi:hypothetical protein [Devosia aurantiaca]|uniref:hypothetical protein n=1 Tax=Devosia aurantiaca TaxID=2714858 RepID=UPI001F2CE7E0|nr:hypothetical protein [Devosia aurantiaca]
MSVLVLAELDNQKLSPATARITAAAAQLGPVDLLVTSPEAATAAAAIAGISKVLVVKLTLR